MPIPYLLVGVQHDAGQHGELFAIKDTGPFSRSLSVKVSSNSAEVQSQSWKDGKDGSALLCSSDRQSAAGHDYQKILGNEEQSVLHEAIVCILCILLISCLYYLYCCYGVSMNDDDDDELSRWNK